MLRAGIRVVLVLACATAILALAIMGVWTLGDTKADPTPKQPILGAPVFALSAYELQAAFAAGEAAATAHYQGKIIEIRGVITAISPSLTDWPAVLLETCDRCRDVVCYFQSTYVHQIRRMRAGQEVVFVGRCIGALEGIPRVRDSVQMR